MKCPCKDCITKAICINRKELQCTILLKFLNKSCIDSVYPEWPELLENMCIELRGNWCAVSINGNIYKVELDRKDNSFDFWR